MSSKIKALFERMLRARKNASKRSKICEEENAAAKRPNEGAWKTWRILALGIAGPTIIMGTIVNIVLLAMCGEIEGPPFVPYEYMYRRVRRFPWGDGEKTLFHNPDLNALPDGYEPGHGPTQRYNEDLDEDADEDEEPPSLESKAEEEDVTDESDNCKSK